MKTLVLRFDIDTYKCISKGVPNLLELASDEQVKLTFYCNMGRAISRAELIRKFTRRLRGSATSIGAKKLSVTAKLGLAETLRTLILNPRVGLGRPDLIRRAHQEGHDIGLHGGSNHGIWQHGFHRWSRNRIHREVSAGKNMFTQVLGRAPKVFSSPGWRGSPELNALLGEMDFDASANRHGPNENIVLREDGIFTLPTNLLSEPGGVAYFESLALNGAELEKLTVSLRESLQDERTLYVLYDHPCFAGTRGLEMVRLAIGVARDLGVEVATLETVLQRAMAEP